MCTFHRCRCGATVEPSGRHGLIPTGGVNDLTCCTSCTIDTDRPFIVMSQNKNRKLSRLVAIDDSKAGMSQVNKDEVNALIMEMSEKSKFHQKQLRRQNEIDERVARKLDFIDTLTIDQIRQAEQEADAIIEEYRSRIDYSKLIVHVDLDAFFANVEIRDDPSLEHIPMAVGSTHMLSK
ncbi:hypothetical protein ACOME3_004177 [Neoechinorhynchus agilis]